eukprot:CAMPEP_0180146046 /NCGR_PEP_ID=MMETSP0986-20121125/18166_1 /TAXON_ID=697907 /ORGANISM="non described non described, Strain CCMP2293" /LENGTH=104 /DNA_ID=CAMNT_0022090807 /DNA_START=276 /DNA_END=586 /DNA_ORIENTATION=-
MLFLSSATRSSLVRGKKLGSSCILSPPTGHWPFLGAQSGETPGPRPAAGSHVEAAKQAWAGGPPRRAAAGDASAATLTSRTKAAASAVLARVRGCPEGMLPNSR